MDDILITGVPRRIVLGHTASSRTLFIYNKMGELLGYLSLRLRHKAISMLKMGAGSIVLVTLKERHNGASDASMFASPGAFGAIGGSKLKELRKGWPELQVMPTGPKSFIDVKIRRVHIDVIVAEAFLDEENKIAGIRLLVAAKRRHVRTRGGAK